MRGQHAVPAEPHLQSLPQLFNVFLYYSLAGIPLWNNALRLDTREDGIASATKGEGPRGKGGEHWSSFYILSFFSHLPRRDGGG